MGAPTVPSWKWIDWNYKDLVTKVKLNQMMEDTFYCYQRRVKDGDDKRNLIIRVDPVLPLQKVNILADALYINDIEQTDLNTNIDITASGVGGLDTGSVAVSTWYAMWIIHNQLDVLTRGIFSLSATSPTLPTNYTKKRRVGWVKTDGSSNILKFVYYNNGWFIWDVEHNVLSGGTATSFTDVDLSSYVPSTATKVVLHWAYNGDGRSMRLYLRPDGTSWTLPIETFTMGDQLAGYGKLRAGHIEMWAPGQIVEYYEYTQYGDPATNLDVKGYYDPI